MPIIGTFTQDGKSFSGELATLTITTKLAIRPVRKSGEKAPDYRVYVGEREIGAAWRKISKKDTPYLAVSLDDPSFAATVQARLIAGQDGEYGLFWNR